MFRVLVVNGDYCVALCATTALFIHLRQCRLMNKHHADRVKLNVDPFTTRIARLFYDRSSELVIYL